MQSFETTVLPVAQKFAAKAISWDEDLQATAVSLAWYYWHKRQIDFPASVWARCGVRAALAGRDLPGLTSSTDVFDRLVKWSGAGMHNVMEKRPGPDKLAEHRELMEQFLQGLSPARQQIFLALLDDASGLEIARRLERTPARVSQMRREYWEQWTRLARE